MVYLQSEFLSPLGAVVQSACKQGHLGQSGYGQRYRSRAPVIVGSNPTRPTIDLDEREDQEHRLSTVRRNGDDGSSSTIIGRVRSGWSYLRKAQAATRTESITTKLLKKPFASDGSTAESNP